MQKIMIIARFRIVVEAICHKRSPASMEKHGCA
jgi:hypothetical protein